MPRRSTIAERRWSISIGWTKRSQATTRRSRSIPIMWKATGTKGCCNFAWDRLPKAGRATSGGAGRTCGTRAILPALNGTARRRGRRVLLYAEQALGDTLQFARFARTVAGTGADVILEVQPPLAKLMQTLQGGVTVVARGATAARVRLPSSADERAARDAAAGRVGGRALSRSRAGTNRALATSSGRGGLPGRDRLARQSQGAGSEPRDPAGGVPAIGARARCASHQPAEEPRRR